MQFSWTGIVIAPLLVPLVFSTAMAGSFGGQDVLVPFLVLLIPGVIISYGSTIGLLLPSLFVLSSCRRMTTFTVCLLGAVLGFTVFIAITLVAWASSGPDSGPPTETLGEFLSHWMADPTTAIFPVAGLLTAGLYWRLGAWRQRKPGAAEAGAPGSETT
jgi:hypothetical protein